MSRTSRSEGGEDHKQLIYEILYAACRSSVPTHVAPIPMGRCSFLAGSVPAFLRVPSDEGCAMRSNRESLPYRPHMVSKGVVCHNVAIIRAITRRWAWSPMEAPDSQRLRVPGSTPRWLANRSCDQPSARRLALRRLATLPSCWIGSYPRKAMIRPSTAGLRGARLPRSQFRMEKALTRSRPATCFCVNPSRSRFRLTCSPIVRASKS